MRLSDLTTAQIRMLTRMAGPFAPEDAVGVEVAEVDQQGWDVAHGLVKRGLAELQPGWGTTAWFTLTDKGRKVRETGEA